MSTIPAKKIERNGRKNMKPFWFRAALVTNVGVPVRLGAIGAVMLSVAGALGYVDGWLSLVRLTQDRMVAAFQDANGTHAGFRRNHAKGVCATGWFESSGQAYRAQLFLSWRQEVGMKTYDLVVIGSGTAAQVASARVRKAGRTVAVADHRPFGGTCALRGCDPKKMLISGAESVDAARRMQGHGIAGELRINWPELIAFKRTFTDPVPQKQEARYAEQGIDAFHGLARFAGPDAVIVAGQELKARHILIATGARPVPLRLPGAEHIITSDCFLELESLPPRTVLIGGGYIAAEFSHIAARAGAQVTVLQRADHMLQHFDPDLVGWLMVKFTELGIDVRMRATVARIEQTANGFLVHADGPGGKQAVAADLVVHAAGREPDLEELDLAAGHVAVSKRSLELNEYLQSVSNPLVYAAGDAASVGPPLTSVSGHDGKVVAGNILEGNRHKPDYRGVPSVAFTVPPMASVGLNES
jgi:glutathione reductase (NADPH)